MPMLNQVVIHCSIYELHTQVKIIADLYPRTHAVFVTPCRSELAREVNVQREFGRIREPARSYWGMLNRGFLSDTGLLR